LDDLAKDSGKNIKSWSLAKIDVEGNEGFVIDGAKETLHQVEILVMEFSPSLSRMAGRNPASILNALTAHFSRIYRFENTELVKVSAKDCLGSEKQVELVFDR
jgi:hypothetical protein